jgi:hypothetical protein
MSGKIRNGEFADGTWPHHIKNPIKMCLDYMDVTEYVYDLVASNGPIWRSELADRREQQIALRLALLSYFECDTHVKNVDDRMFWLASEKPKPNVLNL